jgi:hypothetical protein
MNRRSALKNLSLGLGGLVSLPAWAQGWSPATVGPQSLLTVADETLLGEIVEAILPATTAAGKPSPGAKELKVHQFALRMINDCYDAYARTTLNEGLVAIESAAKTSYGKSFASLTQPERVAVLTTLSQGEGTGRAFVSLIKNLTIQGYTNSEYYLTNVANYNMAPGFYHGCVPVSKVAVR